jgi:hypothetical protein
VPLQIFLDISGHDYWHRRQYQDFLGPATRSRSGRFALVDSPDLADCILRIGGCPSLRDSWRVCFELPKAKALPEFVWEMGDLPTGGLPGLYVSLPSYMYDPRRHRSFCLPYTCNELIRPYEYSEARYLYGYCGSTSSGLRGRLNPLLCSARDRGEALVDIREPIWDKMFNRSGLQEKQLYADILRQTRFNLCPRGCVLAGVGSRLFETIQAARVPVIISDHAVLPAGINWDMCSVRIKERDISKISKILTSYESSWMELASNARLVYEEHFSADVLLDEIGSCLQALLACYQNDSPRSVVNSVSSRVRIALGFFLVRLLSAYAGLQKFKLRFAGS